MQTFSFNCQYSKKRKYITELSAPGRFRTIGHHQWSADRSVQYHIFAIKESIPKNRKIKILESFQVPLSIYWPGVSRPVYRVKQPLIFIFIRIFIYILMFYMSAYIIFYHFENYDYSSQAFLSL